MAFNKSLHIFHASMLLGIIKYRNPIIWFWSDGLIIKTKYRMVRNILRWFVYGAYSRYPV